MPLKLLLDIVSSSPILPHALRWCFLGGWKRALLKALWQYLGCDKNSLCIHEWIQQKSNIVRWSEGKIEWMYKYFAFYVKFHVSGVAPCVNPSENSSRTLMENTFDEVGSLTKIHSDGYINHYLKKCNLGLSGSRIWDLSHPKRKSCH